MELSSGLTNDGLALTEPEQRLLDLARERMPLAEVAVRLGVPMGEADRRIILLCAKLGVPDRAALQLLLNDKVRDEPPLLSEDAEETTAAPSQHVSRRRLLGAAVASSIAAASAGTLLLRRKASQEEVRTASIPETVESPGDEAATPTTPQPTPSPGAISVEMISGFDSGGIAFIRDGNLWVYDVYSQGRAAANSDHEG